MMKRYSESNSEGLYRDIFEQDNCGIGAVISSKGIKSHMKPWKMP